MSIKKELVADETKINGNVYVTTDHTDPDSAEYKAQLIKQYLAHGNRENPARIIDLVTKLSKDSYTTHIPVADRHMDDAWKNAHNNPTEKDYYDLWAKKEEAKGKSQSNLDVSRGKVQTPDQKDWVDVENIYISTLGEQRFVCETPKGTKNCYNRAFNFNFEKLGIRLAKLKQPGGTTILVAYDGGSSVTSAILRGVTKVPASIVEVEDWNEVMKLFHACNNDTKTPMQDIDVFKTKLMSRDKTAMYLNRLLGEMDVTLLRHHPNKKRSIKLSALSKVTLGQSVIFDCTSSSLNGDSKDQVLNDSLYVTRTTPYVLEMNDVNERVWGETENEIHSSVFHALVSFKGVFDGLVNKYKLIAMLKDIKDGNFVVPANIINPNLVGDVDASSQAKFSSSLNLTEIQTKRNYGAFALAHIWNYRFRNDDSVHTIQSNFLKQLYNSTKYLRYNETTVYKKTDNDSVN